MPEIANIYGLPATLTDICEIIEAASPLEKARFADLIGKCKTAAHVLEWRRINGVSFQVAGEGGDER